MKNAQVPPPQMFYYIYYMVLHHSLDYLSTEESLQCITYLYKLHA